MQGWCLDNLIGNLGVCQWIYIELGGRQLWFLPRSIGSRYSNGKLLSVAYREFTGEKFRSI